MKYFVRAGGRDIAVEVDGERVTVEGRTLVARAEPIPGTPLRQVTIEGRTALLAAWAAGRGNWTLGARGETWDLEVLDERTRHIRQLTGEGDRPRGPSVLRAPMPGLVLRLAVTVGSRVAPGDPLLVLEAMKMENELRATAPGVVAAVRVAGGAAVEKGQVLVEFEGGEAGADAEVD